MKIITFDAHLIELGDIVHVQDHIKENSPCVAYFKITYPDGGSNYFMAAAIDITYASVSIGREVYEAVLRINQ